VREAGVAGLGLDCPHLAENALADDLRLLEVSLVFRVTGVPPGTRHLIE
jgi:hypothetical protein